MNAIILCGGLSTRLGDITKTIPKILLTVGDRTVLDWQLEKLKRLGISRAVLAAGHLADVLRSSVGNERNGVALAYAIEPERLGTGGAIKHAWSQVQDVAAPTLIFNGDILTAVDFNEMRVQLKTGSDGIILGAKAPDCHGYGTLIFNDKNELLAFREKEGLRQSGYINGGIYMFNPSASSYFPDRPAFSIEYDVFPFMKNLSVYPTEDPWIDIGVPERLMWARDNWREFLK